VDSVGALSIAGHSRAVPPDALQGRNIHGSSMLGLACSTTVVFFDHPDSAIVKPIDVTILEHRSSSADGFPGLVKHKHNFAWLGRVELSSDTIH